MLVSSPQNNRIFLRIEFSSYTHFPTVCTTVSTFKANGTLSILLIYFQTSILLLTISLLYLDFLNIKEKAYLLYENKIYMNMEPLHAND